MSHEVETMAYAGKVPWHGLGVKVSNDLSPEEMLKAAGLDWMVKKVALSYEATVDGSKRRFPMPKHKALIRETDGQLMTIVSDKWNHLQNEEAFRFFKEFVDAGQMEMHTAGALKSGRIVWALARVKEAFDLFGGDTVEEFLLFVNPHLFGRTIEVMTTEIRVVCHNTMTAALDGKSARRIAVSHRNKFDPEVVKDVLGIAKGRLNQYREVAEFLASRRYTKETLRQYFKEVFPSSSQKGKESLSYRRAFENLEIQPGAKFGEGTWWQAFNTVTFLTDHVLGNQQQTRLESAWFGSNARRKAIALDIAKKFAKAA